ncbi:MAG: hypothetical protein LBG28_03465 [Tannerella sp.]|jgi:hypothetical protein|nr:hypothetical protein [Tannerella sp.]
MPGLQIVNSDPSDPDIHQDIIDGGILKIIMGNKPNYNYGKNPIHRPQAGGD